MFKSAETGANIDKDEYEDRVAKLRVNLINAQFDLKSRDFSVLILIDGDDRWGAEEVVDRLNEWMDARELTTEVLHAPTQEELARPRFWRYWRNIPKHGQVGLFLGAGRPHHCRPPDRRDHAQTIRPTH